MRGTYIKASILLLFWIHKISAQIVNIGDLSISPNTQFSTLADFNNTATGDFLNDGNCFIYGNFKNDGLVTFSNSSNGKTFFAGTKQQSIEGSAITYFKNIMFENGAELVPFHLRSAIVVANKAEFKKGIINAADYDGRLIFEEKAFYSDAGNLSFLDGNVEKRGNETFEFPIGDKSFFRPSYKGGGSDLNNVYTIQYLFENAGNVHPFSSKEDSVLEIDQAEYWSVTQDKGSEKIILSLTLDSNTTPASFFEQSSEKELAIVRWDNTTSKWINEKGIVGDPLSGSNYSKLITAQVSGYGIFTLAFVKKVVVIPDTDVVVFNAISPNGDGINDTFHIKGIDKYPDNTVEIYNRWGVKVFEANAYNETDNMFRGYSDGRSTIKKGVGLPVGTYFYILKYNTGSKTIEKSGYLYISNQ
ncbi:gliding motility-associated C-terminal domain-containing protein [Flavobacterium sp. 2]|uniref:gliding motility-associated C-terminal domain-containing protein n=1 Tax=Flavobacterium sp. 2 TaxID=308053 RepID=UPI003CF2916A